MIRLAVENRQTGFSIQIWKNYTDKAEIALISPSGIKVGPFQERLGPQRFSVEQTEIQMCIRDSRTVCAQTIREYLGQDPALKDSEEFQKLQKEYVIRVEGGEVWVGE